MSLSKANEHRNAWFEGVQKCHLDETLYTVMERIVRAEVHRLVVVDENDKVIGIISLSDILLYLVLRPSGEGIGGTEQSVRASDPQIQTKTDDSCDQSIDNSLVNDDNNIALVEKLGEIVISEAVDEIKDKPKITNDEENVVDVVAVVEEEEIEVGVEEDDDGTNKIGEEDHTKSDECLSARSDSPSSLTQETKIHDGINSQVTPREIGLVSE